MTRDGYRIIIDLADVAEGDATALAQTIWDDNADDFDAAQGDFEMTVARVEASGSTFALDWEPHQ